MSTGIAIVVYPTQHYADIILERSGSGAGWAALTTVIDPPDTGYLVTDLLPMDNTVYAYRCKHNELGYASSSYSTVVSGTATTLPDVISGWPAPSILPSGSIGQALVLTSPTVWAAGIPSSASYATSASYAATSSYMANANFGNISGSGNMRIHNDINAGSSIIADKTIKIGNPTGVNSGTGNMNLSGDIYKNGTAYNNPDYVFEKYYTDAIVKFANNSGANTYRGLSSLEFVKKYTESHLQLPGMPDTAIGVFARADMALEKIEELFLYIFELEERIKQLERKS